MVAEVKTLHFAQGVVTTAPNDTMPVTVGPSVMPDHAVQRQEAQLIADDGDADTLQLAKDYTDQEIADLVDSSPATLDTLAEIAAALGEDPNFSTTIMTMLSQRLRFDVDNQGLTNTEKLNAKTNLGIEFIGLSGLLSKLRLTESTDATTTGANATALAPTTPVVVLTDASLVSIDLIPVVADGITIWSNKTGVAIKFNNLLGVTPIQQIETGTGADLEIAPNAMVMTYYSSSAQRHKVVGGSGGGGGGKYVVNATQTLGAGGQLASIPGQQWLKVASTGGSITLNIKPLVSTPDDGVVVTIENKDPVNSITIPYSDTADGSIGNGDITLGPKGVASWMYDAIDARLKHTGGNGL